VCSSGVCQHLGDPCSRGSLCSNTCVEETNSCITPSGVSCDDGLYCNGKDTCDGSGNCVHQGNPCDQNKQCNNICNERNSTCVVTDGTSCNGDLQNNCKYVDAKCQSGVCVVLNSSTCVISPDNNNVVSTQTANKLGTTDIAIICGSVIGGIIALMLIIVLVVMLINRRSRASQNKLESKIDMQAGSSDYDDDNITSRLPATGGVTSPGNTRMMLTPNMDNTQSPLSVRKAVAYSAVHAERLRMISSGTSISELTVGNPLGSANFGEIYYATWGEGADEVQLALKKLVRPDKFEKFRDEVNILRQVSHSNVVKYYGVFSDHNLNEMYIGLEYMNMGSLYDVLQILGEKISQTNMIDMSLDIAIGMSYIEQCDIVHRDVTTRNVLVSNHNGKYMLKVSDFGSAVVLPEGTTTHMSNDVIVPIRYSAVEVIRDSVFSTKSDVWSFGVCMWEIFSYGLEPYHSCSDFQVSEYITRGDRLDRPADMNNDIYNNIIYRCWSENPADRPSFQEITDVICGIIRDNDENRESEEEEDDENAASTTAADKLQKGKHEDLHEDEDEETL